MEREKWLDTLKGLACLIVFLDHFYLAFRPQLEGVEAFLNIKPFAILINGNFAVCLFLLISAYIISSSVYCHRSFEAIQKIAFKRYFRLMPPIFFASILSLVISKTIGYFNDEVGAILNNGWLTGFFSQELTVGNMIKTSLVDVWWKGNSIFNGPFWMLYIMFLGTFLVIILSIITATGKKGGVLVLSCVLGIYLYLEDYLFCMVLGNILGYLKCNTEFFSKWNKNNICIVISVMLLLSAFYLPAYQIEIMDGISKIGIRNIFKNRIFYNGMGSFFLVFSVMGLSKIKTFLGRSTILDRINEISFSIYLVHWPIISSFSCFVYLKLSDSFQQNMGMFMLMLFVCTVIVVLVFSKLFYEVIEKRVCNKFVEKICNSYFG